MFYQEVMLKHIKFMLIKGDLEKGISIVFIFNHNGNNHYL